MEPTVNQNYSVTSQQSTNTSYSQATQQCQYPTNAHAIVVESIEGASIKDYLKALATKIDSSQIRFISKLANQRICIYLSSKEVANDLVNSTRILVVNGKILYIRPLISENKRIIISNVHRIIPHGLIAEILKNKGINPMSSITYMRAGMNEPGFTHICSFRRQVYINPTDINKLPEATQVTFDNTTYWIYFSTDSIKCFLCKQEGHLAKNCEISNSQSNTQSLIEDISDSPIAENTNEIIQNQNPAPLSSPIPQSNDIFLSPLHPPSANPPNLDLNNTLNTNNNKSKRQLSVSSNSTQSQHTSDLALGPVFKAKTERSQKDTRPSKKSKTNIPTNNDMELLKPIQDILEQNPSKYEINFLQLVNFMEKLKNNVKTSEAANELNLNNDTLENVLRDLYPHLQKRSIKSRFTRIIHKLERPLNDYSSTATETSEYLSD